MEIINATRDDLGTIFRLYDEAIEFQKTVFDKHWLGFDETLISREIDERRLWKIVEDGRVACIFSVAYSDPIIWLEKSSDPAMYIHRIVTSKDFRGRGYTRKITEWAKGHAVANGLRYVRMDTWGDNRKLIDYYTDCGFKFLGLTTPERSDEMPKHYAGINLSLFEIDLELQK